MATSYPQGTIQRTSGDVSTPASNTAAVITYPLVSGAQHVIHSLEWSYNVAPTGGNLKVEDGASTVFSVDVTAAGPGFIIFEPALAGTAATAMTVTLAAGGNGVTGKVCAGHRQL